MSTGFVGWKPEKKSPLGKHGRRGEDNIKMGLQEMEWEDMGWIDLAEDRDRWRALVDALMNLRVPQNAGNFLTN